MNATIFSIGLNVGSTEPAEQLKRTLNALVRAGNVQDIMLGAEWAGTRERILHARVDVAGDVVEHAGRMARELSQDAVAVLDGTQWRLVDKDALTAPGGTVHDFPLLLAAA